MSAITDIRPGVASVIRDPDGRVLLHRRVVGNGWAPPSGAVEPGEDLRSALLREVQEETDLSVEIVRLVGIYSDPEFQVVDYPGGRRVHFVTCVFACRTDKSEVHGSSEGEEWAWFHTSSPPAELLPYARIWLSDALRPSETVVVR
jgi:ADP-ribose pyrophosphatase YjhB (NUDIX family)